MEYTFYKLVCKDSKITEIYVGKTTDTRKRWNDHKSICNNENRREYNYKVYQFIRDNGNIDNWKMVEIEKKNLNKDKACLREGYWYEELKATLNTCKPG
nr:GIY-YIG nuclease family protein [Nitrosopumilaceae archaeon]